MNRLRRRTFDVCVCVCVCVCVLCGCLCVRARGSLPPSESTCPSRLRRSLDQWPTQSPAYRRESASLRFRRTAHYSPKRHPSELFRVTPSLDFARTRPPQVPQGRRREAARPREAARSRACMKRRISTRPRRMMAALLLSPSPMPSTKPAPSATTCPHNSKIS